MRTHRFKPSHHHHTFGPYDPVLHIASGDRIETSTVDALGHDAQDRPVTDRGNPLTGPFWVEGAEPGHVLAVHIERIEPNRWRGFSRSSLAPNVLDPLLAVELGRNHPDGMAEWAVDTASGTASLVRPDVGLAGLALAIEPMLGCIGVAPKRQQAISTVTSAEHGGNMDYRGVREGTSLYFPVFEPGGLLYVGDAHALQGDGEISGTGIEISADVSMVVELCTDVTIGWPRGEKRDEVFTIGNARPLQQALQHATSEMMRWLTGYHGLDTTAAALLMSQCVRYDVGNVFDPAYTMVCRIPVWALKELATSHRRDGALWPRP